MTTLKPILLLILAGILYALGFPSSFSQSLLITPIIGFSALLYYLFDDYSFKSKLFKVLAFNFGFNLMGYYWITNTLIEFGALPYPVALLLSQLHSLIIAPYLYAFILLLHLLQKKSPQILKGNFTIISLCLSLILTLFEYYIHGQFQSMIGQPFIIFGNAISTFARIAGIPIFSFMSYILCFEILRLLKFRRVSFFPFFLWFCFISSNFLFGKLKHPRSNPIFIRLVQANISNFLKTDSESGSVSSVDEVINKYKSLSLEQSKLIQKKPDLIVWPETAYPHSIETEKNNFDNVFLPYIFKEISEAQNANLFIGGYNRKAKSYGYYLTDYNSEFFINRDGNLKDIYHKQVLIPFGETLPFGPLNKWLSKKIHNISFFARGEKNNIFTLDTGHRFLNSICYEVLDPEFIRRALNDQKLEAHALINLTNDSWYGDTAEPHQHLFLASWRSIEFNLPMIRSTNTGISAIIDQSGQPSKVLGIGVSGNLDAIVALPEREPTFYQIWGIWSFLLIFSIIFIFYLLMLKCIHVTKKFKLRTNSPL